MYVQLAAVCTGICKAVFAFVLFLFIPFSVFLCFLVFFNLI